MYNYGNAAMDTQKYSGVDSANASTTMFSPPSDQNNYAASGINHNTNELIQNSLAFNNGLYNQMENLPVVQNSTIAQSSTHSAQQELNRSRNDLPEGDREYGSDMISKESEGHALSEGAAMHHDPQKTEESVSEQNIVTTVEKLPEAATKKRVCDTVRVQKVLEELSAKLSAADQGLGVRHKRQKISDDARSLVVEYAKELSSAILEESCLLAKHRNSKELIAADIKLIFGGLL